jgi:catechol 2,3-dioxygenase-like lactoylglutathione lyase family enzyme
VSKDKKMNNTNKKSHSPIKPRIIGLSHIGLFVHDMKESLKFYTKFLGYEEQFELREKDDTLLLKFMKVNDRQFIELFPEPDTKTDRLYQVAFIVEDIEAMRSYFEIKGIMVPEKAKMGKIGNLGFTIKDPDGHILEFVQYLPEGWTLQDTGKHLSSHRISSRLKHIGFTVKDLEPSLAFYRDILGCTITWMGSSDNKRLSWVNMKLPDSDEYLELMLYYDDLSWQQKGVLNHMSLDVEDLSEAVDEAALRAQKGLYTLPIEPKTGLNLKRQLNLYDPDGTRAELMEPLTVDHREPQWFQPEDNPNEK